jgi:hypothetical protein
MKRRRSEVDTDVSRTDVSWNIGSKPMFCSSPPKINLAVKYGKNERGQRLGTVRVIHKNTGVLHTAWGRKTAGHCCKDPGIRRQGWCEGDHRDCRLTEEEGANHSIW